MNSQIVNIYNQNLPYTPLKKGWANWWEAELHTVKSKKSERQKIKKLLKNL